ncbi:MAG: MFS transporter [Spirochaetaceae bacterium]|nr:MFS transporter [Spirochaetaceae bacterium]
MTNLRSALRQFHADVYRHLVASTLVGFSYFGFVTVLLNLYLLRLGYGTDFIGLVNGSTAIAFAASSLPAGAIGSRFGMRRAVVGGMGFLAAGVMLVPIVALLPAGGTRDVAIIAMRLLSGIGFSLYMVNSYPYLVAATDARDRPYAFALLAAVPPVAGFAGSIISGALPGWIANGLRLDSADPLPFALILVFSGVILVPNLWIVARTRDLDPPKRRRTGTARRRTAREVRRADGAFFLLVFFLGITALLRMAGESAARSFFNVYLELDLGASTSRIGLLLAFGQLAAGPAALCAPAIAARAGKVPVIVVTTAITAASLVIMALVPHWLAAGIGFTLVVGMRSVTQSVTSLVHMEIVPASRRGLTSGVTSMSMGLGFSSMALGGGYLIPALGFPGLYLLGALITALSALIFWQYFRVPQGEYRLTAEQPAATVPAQRS